jgi:tetratricopeptide (TPR) repeat protein
MRKIVPPKQNLIYRILPLLFFCLFLLPALVSKAFAQGGDASKSPPPTRPTVKSGTVAKRPGRAPQPNEGTLSPAERHFKKGQELYEQSKYPEAETELREAIRLAPNNVEYHKELGSILQAQQKEEEGELEYGKAETILREAIKRAPNNAKYHYLLGDTLSNIDRIPEAETEYGEAVRLNPNNAEYHFLHGLSFENLVQRDTPAEDATKRLAAAEVEYRAAVRLNPNYKDGWYFLEGNLEWQKKQAEAESAVRDGLRVFPNDAGLNADLARIFLSQQRWSDAETYYRKALLNSSKDNSSDTLAVWRDGLATALSRQGKMVEAETQESEAIRLSPNNKSYRDNLSQIQNNKP